MYSVEEVRGRTYAEWLLPAHEQFFKESIYKKYTWNPAKALATIMGYMMSSDVITLAAITPDGACAGFFEFQTESPWMDEVVALCINFYITPEHRNGECSQMLLDFGIKICEARGAKLAWQSSTAGFSDNGANERAFKMFLKRNGFREIGTFLVREFSK